MDTHPRYIVTATGMTGRYDVMERSSDPVANVDGIRVYEYRHHATINGRLDACRYVAWRNAGSPPITTPTT